MRAGARLLVLCSVTVLGAGCSGATDAHPALLTANVVDPQSVNAVSLFNSCEGHSYPQSNSPNSAKNYFWPNSTNFG